MEELRPYSPLPWSIVKVGMNNFSEPVAVIHDANGCAVAEYLIWDDAHFIVQEANKRVSV